MIKGINARKILLKSGRIIDPFSKKTFNGDLLIEFGKISKISDSISTKGKDYKVINCKGLVVTHGFCDMHVHFREPGREDKETLESGSYSALAGGFTQVCTMANTNPVIDSPEHIHYIVSKSQKLPIDIFPIGAVSKGMRGEELTEMLLMQKNGAIAFSDDGVPIQNAQFMKLALTYSKMLNVPIMNHAEDIFLRNDGVMNASSTSNNLGLKGNTSLGEAVMVYRDLLLAESLNSKLHLLHLSTKEAVDLLKQFKSKKQLITAEVSPHHLYFVDEDIDSFDTNLKVAPPVRSKKDRKALIEGIKSGLIDCIATDHAPHTLEDKETTFNEAAFGMIGLESCFGVVNKVLVKENGMSLKSLIEKITVNPRKVMNLETNLFATGSKAQITIFDPNEKWKFKNSHILSKSSNSPFIGKDLVGKVKFVISKNQFFTL
ncbi:MAG: dihydroorotase [Candidatus Marinimicrobia bacterium]|nr:dihydroorotase [Candidatus Neomarinimicrobiota bacterium]